MYAKAAVADSDSVPRNKNTPPGDAIAGDSRGKRTANQ